MRALSIALMQIASNPSLTDFDAKVRDVVTQTPGVELIVFPELHLTSPSDASATEHEALPGPRSEQLGAIAKKYGVWLIPGSVFEATHDALFNTLLVFSPGGDLITTYRKIFPWRPYEKVKSGNRIVFFDMPGKGRIGLTICYDAWFPEIHRQLAWHGCELIVNVVLTPTIDREQEVVLARANAIVNQTFIASVNAAGPSGIGRSLIVDPEGRVRSHAVGAESAVITDVLYLDTVEEIRERGTAGLNCIWKQLETGDDVIDLPVYDGRLSADIWQRRERPSSYLG